MAGNKYLTLSSGRQTMISSLDASTGAPDAGKIVALDSTGKLDASMMPLGVTPDVSTVLASENLSAGDYVNLYNNSGVINARRADNSNDRQAHCFVKSAVTSGNNASVFFEGPNANRSGLTVGSRYYLDVTGGVTTTAPSSGILQFLGVAINATTINTDIEDSIVL